MSMARNNFGSEGHDTRHDRAMRSPARFLGALAPWEQHCVVVPLDGSKAAESAIPYALTIAIRTAAAIRLVHVHQPLDALVPWERYFSPVLIHHELWLKQSYLLSVAHEIRRRADVSVTAIVVESWDVAESVRQAAASASVMVLAHQKRGIFRRLVTGSKVETLTQELSCPLLVVPENHSLDPLMLKPKFHHAFLAFEAGWEANEVISSARAVGLLKTGRMSTAHALAHGHKSTHDPEPSLGFVQRNFQWLKHKALDCTGARLPAKVVRAAAHHGADFIIVASERMKSAWRSLYPSLSMSVVRQANMPVLVVPPANIQSSLRNT